MQMQYVNLTPHPIQIVDSTGAVTHEYPPSGVTARLAEERVGVRDTGHAAVSYGSVEGLPPEGESADTMYIVPLLVALAVRRPDLVVPYNQIRNESGTVVGTGELAHVE